MPPLTNVSHCGVEVTESSTNNHLSLKSLYPVVKGRPPGSPLMGLSVREFMRHSIQEYGI
jgi:hypothetical protein